MKIDFDNLSLGRLRKMAKAGDEILEAFRLLGESETNAVAQVLAHQGAFCKDEHYPRDDVCDSGTGSQYYYHAHRLEAGEHGHFHTFVRAKAIPASYRPAPIASQAVRPVGEDAICHLVAISMDRAGIPIRLFTTNQWVTGETFYSARETIRLIDRFSIDLVHPCLATNRWITAMIPLFRPQIEALLIERDRVISAHAMRYETRDVLEDEALEITSEVAIDIDEQIAGIDRALAAAKRKWS